MRPAIAIWLALVAVHAAAVAAGYAMENDRLSAIVAGSLYLPLWPLEKLGLPVVRPSGWYFPPITWVGWVALAAFWMAFYWLIASLLTRYLSRRARAA